MGPFHPVLLKWLYLVCCWRIVATSSKGLKDYASAKRPDDSLVTKIQLTQKDEHERLISVWIAPRGKFMNLEILGYPVFRIPTNFEEHEWYHICQSWSSDDAYWELFVNDKLAISGQSEKLRGLTIDSGGDIVVGQEYTDFDKGLEDGIEGDIFGFNFVLSATGVSRQPFKDVYDTTDEASFNSISRHFKAAERRRRVPRNKARVATHKAETRPYRNGSRKLGSANYKSLGMGLVELSRNCRIGKGAPLHGKRVLVSWTKTNVRVFGGAIIKHAKPFC